jgi:hypothetical protein
VKWLAFQADGGIGSLSGCNGLCHEYLVYIDLKEKNRIERFFSVACTQF